RLLGGRHGPTAVLPANGGCFRKIHRSLSGEHARMRNDLMQPAALLSLCSKYRYRLGRRRVGSPPLAFIRFNPRTIDADVVDGATIRSCFGVVKTRSIDSTADLLGDNTNRKSTRLNSSHVS